jgi:hypothetical protein
MATARAGRRFARWSWDGMGVVKFFSGASPLEKRRAA